MVPQPGDIDQPIVGLATGLDNARWPIVVPDAYQLDKVRSPGRGSPASTLDAG